MLGKQGEKFSLAADSVSLETIATTVFEDVWGLDLPTVHHLFFEIDDVEAVTEELHQRGATVKKRSFQPLDGMFIAFFDELDGVNLRHVHYERESS